MVSTALECVFKISLHGTAHVDGSKEEIPISSLLYTDDKHSLVAEGHFDDEISNGESLLHNFIYKKITVFTVTFLL